MSFNLLQTNGDNYNIRKLWCLYHLWCSMWKFYTPLQGGIGGDNGQQNDHGFWVREICCWSISIFCFTTEKVKNMTTTTRQWHQEKKDTRQWQHNGNTCQLKNQRWAGGAHYWECKNSCGLFYEMETWRGQKNEGYTPWRERSNCCVVVLN